VELVRECFSSDLDATHNNRPPFPSVREASLDYKVLTLANYGAHWRASNHTSNQEEELGQLIDFKEGKGDLEELVLRGRRGNSVGCGRGELPSTGGLTLFLQGYYTCGPTYTGTWQWVVLNT
jgi:hypothetical protein